jgi:alanine racemase
VVKANAYGLGMVEVAQRLAYEGAKRFFVANVEEGLTLRDALPSGEIYLLNGLWPEVAETSAQARLTPVLSSLEHLKIWSGYGVRRGTPLPALLQMETGLGRLGLGLKELEDFVNHQGSDFSGIEVQGLISHLACAYQPNHPFNATQRERFDQGRRLFPHLPASLAGSGGIFQGRAYLYDFVRPGRILYGSTFTADPSFHPHVRPVVSLKARILQIQDVPQGHSIGYDQTCYTHRPTRLAVVAMGYADGYFRALSNRASGLLHGFCVPVVGRVSMDLLTVDVTDLPEALCRPGDWVTFLNDQLTVDALAEAAGTISWEVLTRLGERPFFRYKGSLSF